MGQRTDNSAFAECLSAAEGGCAESQYKLALMYATGHGVVQDNVQAHMWFNIAANHGSDRAKTDRKELSLDMGPDEIAEAQRLARERIAVGPDIVA